MKIKTVEKPKTIKIDEPTWYKLNLLKLKLGRETLDDTIYYLLCRWEKEHGDL